MYLAIPKMRALIPEVLLVLKIVMAKLKKRMNLQVITAMINFQVITVMSLRTFPVIIATMMTNFLPQKRIARMTRVVIKDAVERRRLKK